LSAATFFEEGLSAYPRLPPIKIDLISFLNMIQEGQGQLALEIFDFCIIKYEINLFLIIFEYN
jgi:hypothetical protein